MNTRETLLNGLKQGRGAWVSGQFLSEGLAMTRSAVWKQIRALKEDGYEIEASPRKGYRLRGVPDLLLLQEVRDGLTTRAFGQTQALYFLQTDSTNLRAREMAAQGAPEGTLVVAEQQTHGRGRRQRVWFSPPRQGIYASLILRPAIAPTEAPRMTLLAAVAVAETLLALTPLEAKIKWPNDILVRGRKIAGILTEISTGMDAIDHVVIGLGLNVNIPAIDFPAEICTQATSILAETGAPFSRSLLLRRFLEYFEYYYDIFHTKGFDPVLQRWRALTDMLGRRVRVDMIGRQHVGEVADFDQDGALILRDEGGRSIRIFSGDITLL
ncbi:MAG: biotin--[acetyl-CoA-carboxylase] ligase [Syntrophus sp. (in: bacteria)]|nr:biotin--[acetyl-CoA-carboxylase] ligase [Syntrophus sp. (in: bacteria)]